jgi:hypothetical protein
VERLVKLLISLSPKVRGKRLVIAIRLGTQAGEWTNEKGTKTLMRIAMSAERIAHIVAGLFILLSLLFGMEASPLFISHNFLWFTAFVGLSMFQNDFTNFCPHNNILAKFDTKEVCC